MDNCNPSPDSGDLPLFSFFSSRAVIRSDDLDALRSRIICIELGYGRDCAIIMRGIWTRRERCSSIFHLKDGSVTPVLKNTSLYHFSMLHVSHHLTPVITIDTEGLKLRRVLLKPLQKLCPLTVILVRVVLTSTAVLLACWQVIYGTDPIMIRSKLRNAL